MTRVNLIERPDLAAIEICNVDFACRHCRRIRSWGREPRLHRSDESCLPQALHSPIAQSPSFNAATYFRLRTLFAASIHMPSHDWVARTPTQDELSFSSAHVYVRTNDHGN
jgi:hypothetical protein